MNVHCGADDLPKISHDAAKAALPLQAFLAGGEIEQIEEPFDCEDGRTFTVRAWLIDGRDISQTYEIARARADVPPPVQAGPAAAGPRHFSER